MAGRHRDNSLSWRLPSVVGVVAVLGLVAVVWLTGLPWFGSSGNSTLARAAAEPRATATPHNSRGGPTTPTTPTTSTTPSSTSTTSDTPTSTPEPTSTTPETSTQVPTTTQPPPSTTEPTTPPPQTCSTVLAGTRPHVAKVGNHIKQRFGVDTVGGRAPRPGGGDHPAGLALDFMVDTATGNNLAAYVLAHQDQFGVKYVIWRQRINMGSGWSMMEDRGGPTANHYDHVHVSFIPGADVSVTCSPA